MFNPPHPSLSVRHDFLEPLGLTVTVAAKALGVTRPALEVKRPHQSDETGAIV